MALRLCASCMRHVRAADPSGQACPFCGASESAGVPEPLSRATRAALVFGSATLVVAGVACGGKTDDSTGDASPPRDAAPDVSGVTLYGLPPPPDASPPPVDAGRDVNIQPPYGAPPPLDAGRDVNVQPPYGAPPPLDAGRD